MNRLILAFFLFISFNGISQLSTFEKKGKIGLKNGEEILLKPKYDSILLADLEVSSAFKKKKLYYISNSSGETIRKGKSEYLEVFRYGSGITSTKSGKNGAVDKSGDYFIEPSKYNKLSYSLGLLHLKDSSYYKKNYLFVGNRIVSEKAQEIEIFNNWVIVKRSKTETHTHTPTKGIFKKRRTTTTTSTNRWMEVYDGYSGNSISSMVDEIVSFDDMIALKWAGEMDLFFNNERIMRDVTFIESRNDSLYEGARSVDLSLRQSGEPQDRFLMDKSTKHILVNGPHYKFDIHENSIYGHGNKDDHDALYIYDINGNLLRTDLKRGWSIDYNRYVFADSLGEFIGTELGDTLSGHYPKISEAKNGIRKVYFDFSYGYINDSSYADLAIHWPVVGERISYSGGGGRRRGLFRGLGRDLGNFGRRLIGKPTKGRSSGYSPKGRSGSDIIILDDGHDFYEEMAIVCLNGLRRDAKYDSIYSFYRSDAIYNYISTTGKLMSTKKYSHCLPFKNGLAWVKFGRYYSRINKKGKTVKTTKYTEIEEDELGFYKVKKAGKCGVIDSDGKSMLACEHAILDYKEGGYYSKYDGVEKLELNLRNEE
jgi:WG containing repeat